MTDLTQMTQERGNTKTLSFRLRKGVFTLNNYTDTEYRDIITWLEKDAKVAIVGKEVGEEGTPHLQGYFEFKNARNIKSKMPRAHIEKRKGSVKDNFVYCSKDGNYWHKGFNIRQLNWKVEIKKMKWWQEDILEKIDKPPDDRTINWYWEEKGCAGKTTFIKYCICNKPDKGIIVLSGKAADMKHMIVEYKKKNDYLPEIIFMNVPRTSLEYLSYTGIEEIKDMLFFSGKYEGGMVCGPNPHIFIFANEKPRYSAMSEDRWNIVNIGLPLFDEN